MKKIAMGMLILSSFLFSEDKLFIDGTFVAVQDSKNKYYFNMKEISYIMRNLDNGSCSIIFKNVPAGLNPLYLKDNGECLKLIAAHQETIK